MSSARSGGQRSASRGVVSVVCDRSQMLAIRSDPCPLLEMLRKSADLSRISEDGGIPAARLTLTTTPANITSLLEYSVVDAVLSP